MLFFFNRDIQTVQVSHEYRDIASWRYTHDQVTLKIGSLVARGQKWTKATTPQAEEVAGAITKFVEALTNRRLREEAGKK
jgi:hypothetical protein